MKGYVEIDATTQLTSVTATAAVAMATTKKENHLLCRLIQGNIVIAWSRQCILNFNTQYFPTVLSLRLQSRVRVFLYRQFPFKSFKLRLFSRNSETSQFHCISRLSLSLSVPRCCFWLFYFLEIINMHFLALLNSAYGANVPWTQYLFIFVAFFFNLKFIVKIQRFCITANNTGATLDLEKKNDFTGSYHGIVTLTQ